MLPNLDTISNFLAKKPSRASVIDAKINKIKAKKYFWSRNKRKNNGARMILIIVKIFAIFLK